MQRDVMFVWLRSFFDTFVFFSLPGGGGVLSRAFPLFRPIRDRQLSPAGQPAAEAREGDEGGRGTVHRRWGGGGGDT